MNAKRVVELHNTLASFSAVHEGATDSEDVAIWVPFDCLDEHPGVDEGRAIIGEALHHLHPAALVNDHK